MRRATSMGRPSPDPRAKLLTARESVALYGTTPPRAGAGDERIARAAERLAERVRRLPVDGLVVYDVQDEAGRTEQARPFPFLPTLDSRRYANRLTALTGLPTIAYKYIAGMTEAAWQPWLTETAQRYGIRYLSLVGRSTSRGPVDGFTLGRALSAAAAHPARFTLGGVVIAERHAGAVSEAERMIRKSEHGCAFFISQAVYDAEATIRLLGDYAPACREHGTSPRRIVLTFVPCGRARTIEFVRWLGVAMPEGTARAILDDPAPLGRSIAICRDNLRRILDHRAAADLPLGINVESVSIYRDEIEASCDLFGEAHAVLHSYRPRPRTDT